jgi:hypothetical protein
MIELSLAGRSGLVALIDDQDAHLLEMAWYAMATPYNTYVFRATNGTTELMHRVIMKASCRFMVDHRNGNGLDNRRANLRLATNAQNARNRKLQVNNTSGVRGVYWCERKQKWRARIKVDNRYIDLGMFTDLEKARTVREKAERRYYGEFVRVD